MPAEPPAARIVHAVPGRMRLRVMAKRGDRDWFDEAAASLAMIAGVEGVATSARTASIRVEHSRPGEAVLAEAARRGVFTLPADGEEAATEGTAGERLRAAAGGFTASEGLAFVLALAALRQVWRGQILPPAVTLLAYAATVLATRDRQPASSDDAPVDSQPGSGDPPPT